MAPGRTAAHPGLIYEQFQGSPRRSPSLAARSAAARSSTPYPPCPRIPLRRQSCAYAGPLHQPETCSGDRWRCLKKLMKLDKRRRFLTHRILLVKGRWIATRCSRESTIPALDHRRVPHQSVREPPCVRFAVCRSAVTRALGHTAMIIFWARCRRCGLSWPAEAWVFILCAEPPRGSN